MASRHRLVDIVSSKYFRTRMITTAITFFAVLTLNFILPRLVPGSFISSISGANNLENEQRQVLIARFGLNQSLFQQFVLYLTQTLGGFHPHFRFSFSYFTLI